MTDRGTASGTKDPDPPKGPPGRHAESLRLFRSLVKASPAAIVGLDREGRVTTWNPAAERIFGWSAKEALGSMPPPFVPKDREEEFQAHMKDVLGGQVRQNREIERMHRDGSRIPLHLAYAPVRDEAGEIIGVMAVLSDISEFKQTAQRLDQVQERYQAWLEVAPDIALTLDAEGQITTLNPAFERITGWAREAWLGRPFTDLIHPEDLDAVLEDYQAAVDGRQPDTTEFRYKTADGSWRWGAVLGRPVVEGDRIVDFFAIVRDITDQKQREEAEREQLRRELEIERLRREAQARQEVLRSTAHELSNPLTPMRFQLEFLRSLAGKADGEAQAQALDVLERNLKRVGRLVDDLKDAARLEGDQLRLQLERVDLATLVPQVAEAYHQVAAEAGLSLEVELPAEGQGGGPVEIQADPSRLEQVLANLLDNAIKFTPEGGTVRVQVTPRASQMEDGPSQAEDGAGGTEDGPSQAEDGAGGTEDGASRRAAQTARISVSDTGPGMTEAQIQALFEPFSQVHQPTAGEGGTGLGLYITRGIVEAHDGRIWCESQGPGEGTTFHVALPVG